MIATHDKDEYGKQHKQRCPDWKKKKNHALKEEHEHESSKQGAKNLKRGAFAHDKKTKNAAFRAKQRKKARRAVCVDGIRAHAQAAKWWVRVETKNRKIRIFRTNNSTKTAMFHPPQLRQLVWYKHSTNWGKQSGLCRWD